MSISEEGASVDFGNLSIITGQQTPKKTPVPKERTIAQPAFDVEELVAKLVGVKCVVTKTTMKSAWQLLICCFCVNISSE
jgi:hypothetical protein